MSGRRTNDKNFLKQHDWGRYRCTKYQADPSSILKQTRGCQLHRGWKVEEERMTKNNMLWEYEKQQ